MKWELHCKFVLTPMAKGKKLKNVKWELCHKLMLAAMTKNSHRNNFILLVIEI